jgi:NDP-sugar pyrophosphorylase family protein
MRKFEPAGETMTAASGRVLYRIRALIDIPRHGVKVGDVGGWVEREDNLSHEGEAWVGGNAQVYKDAHVSGRAHVYDDVQIAGKARVYGLAVVFGNVQIAGRARIYGRAVVFGNVQIVGRARLSGFAVVAS